MKTVARAFSLRAHAKLNLCLEIGPPVGGLHSVATAMAELELADELQFRPSEGGFEVLCDRSDIAAEENLVWRAARALSLPLPDVHIAIAKRIPVQAGLGGGSADAATTLRGLARIFQGGSSASSFARPHEGGAGLSQQQIAAAALRCGSDVPSFLVSGLRIVGGVGDRVIAFDCKPPPWGIALLRPTVGSPTAQAYQMLDQAGVPHDLDGALERAQVMCRAFAAHEFDRVMPLLHNDFSSAMERALPLVALARRRLEAAGARATIMCGSGSCVAGFFESPAAAADAVAHAQPAPGEWATATTFSRDAL